jgi:hypothetical protein
VVQEDGLDSRIESALTLEAPRVAQFSDPAELAERCSRRLRRSEALREVLARSSHQHTVFLLRRLLRRIDTQRPLAWQSERHFDDWEILADDRWESQSTARSTPEALSAAFASILSRLGLADARKAHISTRLGMEMLALDSPLAKVARESNQGAAGSTRKDLFNFLNYRGVQPVGARAARGVARAEEHERFVRGELARFDVTADELMEFARSDRAWVECEPLARAVVSAGRIVMGQMLSTFRSPAFLASFSVDPRAAAYLGCEMLAQIDALFAVINATSAHNTSRLVGGLVAAIAERRLHPDPVTFAVQMLRDPEQCTQFLIRMAAELHPSDEETLWAVFTALGFHLGSLGVPYAAAQASLMQLYGAVHQESHLVKMAAANAHVSVASHDLDANSPAIWDWMREEFPPGEALRNAVLYPSGCATGHLDTERGLLQVASNSTIWTAVIELLDSGVNLAALSGLGFCERMARTDAALLIPEEAKARIMALTRLGDSPVVKHRATSCASRFPGAKTQA